MFLEERRYPPDPEFAAQANAQQDLYELDFEELWAKEAERLTWFQPWTTLLEWEPPYAKWYLGGKLNVCFNCVDRHVEAGKGGKVAYYWEGEPEDDRRELTFADLQAEVVRFANALKELGVKKGTPVGIYMGMVPELPIAMLACARLGAPHTVVFGGFSAESLAGRLNDMECELLITQDEAWRRGTTVPLKRNADEALARHAAYGAASFSGGPATTSRCRRAAIVWWHDLVENQSDDPRVVPAGAHGLRGPALPPLHERHDREAEGDRPHDGRLPRRRGGDPPLHLRRQARFGLLVRGGRRLGDGAQLHRLRAARERDDGRHVRGHARLPGQGPLVGHRRALQGRHPLHGADGDPQPHEVGAGVRGEARSLLDPAARDASASRSTRRPGSGTGSTSAATASPWWTRGGRPRRG